MAYSPNTNKIDDAATNGLTGTSNSLAYRVHEIERHIHGRSRWLGKHAAPTPGVIEANDNMTPFTVTSGVAADTYGSEVCILGTSDTPRMTSNVKFDLHEMLITGVTVDAHTHKFRFIWILASETVADAITAGQYTEVMGKVDAAAGSGGDIVISVSIPRIATGKKVYIQSKDTHVAAITTSFFIGLHEYEG